MLTVRISTLPESLVIRFSRLGVAVADRPNRRLNHGRAYEKLHSSGESREEEDITPGSRGRKLESDKLCYHDSDHYGQLGENPCGTM